MTFFIAHHLQNIEIITYAVQSIHSFALQCNIYSTVRTIYYIYIYCIYTVLQYRTEMPCHTMSLLLHSMQRIFLAIVATKSSVA